MVADGKMIKDRFGIKTELKFDATPKKDHNLSQQPWKSRRNITISQ